MNAIGPADLKVFNLMIKPDTRAEVIYISGIFSVHVGTVSSAKAGERSGVRKQSPLSFASLTELFTFQRSEAHPAAHFVH